MISAKYRPILLAIRLESIVRGSVVNEVISLYGRNNLDIYIANHKKEEIHIIDKEKARQLSRVWGLQLPPALKASDRKQNIPLQKEAVKTKSLMKKLSEYQNKIREKNRQPQIPEQNKGHDNIR